MPEIILRSNIFIITTFWKVIYVPESDPSCVKFVRTIDVLSTANIFPATVATLSVIGPIK